MKTILIFCALIACTSIPVSDPCDDFVQVPFKESYICVSPDYYEIDGVRTPVSGVDARRIAEENNAILPTKEMVDAIYAHADVRLRAITMPPGPQMSSRSYYVTHDRLIDEELNGRTGLIAGHKKDIIQPQKNGRVTIYGWHGTSGNPIQPVSSVHGQYYFDYSHGVRLVRVPQNI